MPYIRKFAIITGVVDKNGSLQQIVPDFRIGGLTSATISVDNKLGNTPNTSAKLAKQK